MAQIVVQDFELQGIPQPLPRPAEHSIDKLLPQLTKGGLYLVLPLTEDKVGSRGLLAGNQHHLRLFGQGCRAVLAR
jgi:hypothetical protein